MKINGALKPRQGASRQGSSPGVVLQKYRVKRYFKQTTTTTLTQQLEQKRICGGNFCGSISSSLRRRQFSTSVGTKIQITPNTMQSRVAEITKAKTFFINLNIWKNKNKSQQKIVAAATEAAMELKNRRKTSVEIDFEQRRAVINNTTRQIKNTKFNKESEKNKSDNINCDEKKTKQVKFVKVTSNTSTDHVTSNKNHNINTTSSTRKRVNNFLFIPKIMENLNFTAIIQLKYLLFCVFSHAIKYLIGNPFTADCGGSGVCTTSKISRTVKGCHRGWGLAGCNLSLMMRVPQLLAGSLERICFTNARRVKPSIAFCMVVYAATAILLPQLVVGDDGDTFFPINGLETTTPEFDYASRGQKKFGDKCENTLECGFPGSICDPKKKSCQCTEDLPVTNHIDKCGKEAAVNESCFFNEQCEVKYFQTECRDQRCVCRFDMTPVWLKDGSVECKGRGDKKGPETYIDPAMIGVLIGMALMFIIICVVLRLFSQARWRENRTIFNTPNPRLMNVSLLRESKLLHGQERRGSRMSVRAPSRQPSMASLRPHSPNPSLGKAGRMTRSKSNTRSSDSRVSDVSNCSRLLEHHTANTHHASHPHANLISENTPTYNHGPQSNVSPISLNAPATIITSANETPVSETTACSTNLTNPSPTNTNKPNKF